MARSRENKSINYPTNTRQLESFILSEFGTFAYVTQDQLADNYFLGVFSL